MKGKSAVKSDSGGMAYASEMQIVRYGKRDTLIAEGYLYGGGGPRVHLSRLRAL